jgi:calcium-dependent protein kinase
MKTQDMAEMLNEVSIMRQLDHPHILQLFEVYSTKRKLWLIMELCYGGDLFSRELNEASSVVVMEQILQALTYMHSIGVTHRDLKLENIMYETPEPNSGIKLIDFGLSQRFLTGENMRKVCGTVYTVSPEIIECDLHTNKLGYTEKSDIFSVGCIAFILLSTDYPFLRSPDEVNDDTKLRRLIHAEYHYGPKWKARNISDAAKDFLAGTLQRDPAKRWSAAEALKFVDEAWIPALEERLASETPDEQEEKSGKALDNASAIKKRRCRVKMKSMAFRGMENYAGYGLMKKTVLIAMAKTMDKSTLSELKDLFISIDSDHTGTISMADFKEACTTYFQGRDFASDENVESVFRAIDTHHSGEVHYNVFLAALAESQGLITMERLQEAFDRIDTEGKGYISKGDLRSIMGTEANETVITQMIDEAGGEDGKFYYDKFLRLMFKDPTHGVKLVHSFRGGIIEF